MRNFDYTGLVSGNTKWLELMKEFDLIKSECLKDCAISFRANLMRTADFAMLPAEMAFQNRRDALFQSNALFTTTGKGVSTLDELLATEPTPEIISEFERQAKDFQRVNFEGQQFYRWALGVTVTEQMSKRVPGMQSSMEALLVSILLESWLFFEAFASDLWVASVNNGGRLISNRINAFREWEKPDSKGEDIDINSKTHQGSFLREIGKATFTKLRFIKHFYGAAFGDDAEKLFETVSGGRINMLSNLRNCIVHSAGKIDKSFKHFLLQAPRFPELKRFENQERIELDGSLVRDMRQVALEMGLALLSHADAILQSDGVT
jgi:hypothetical protein